MVRQARPDDYDAIVSVVDDWWGRPLTALLPRLFLDLFWSTSLVAEEPSGAGLRGFLVGVLSPSEPAEAYVHFVGVAPSARRSGLAGQLYTTFFGLARSDGRRVVRAITSPINERSIEFHRALGFSVRGPVEGHNGPGTSYLLFERVLADAQDHPAAL